MRANVIGTDLVRDTSGRWRVLEDNLRVPSGLAYAMHARDLLATVMPELHPPAGTLASDAGGRFTRVRAAFRGREPAA